MYSPAHYKSNDVKLIRTLIDENSFATLLTEQGGESVSHLPMILEQEKGAAPELLSHMARANPHWRELQNQVRAKVIFHGPHAYISPAWYSPADDNVPTWSYAVVHVRGNFEVVEDPQAALRIMDLLIARFELDNETQWILPQDRTAVNDLMQAITVFRIKDLEFDGKFKLNQSQGLADRENVSSQLCQSKDTNANRLGELMRSLIQQDRVV
jgi:transcriptional regulator